MIRSQNTGLFLEVRQSASVESAKGSAKSYKGSCETGVIGYIPLFYNRTMTIGLRYGCILPCLPIWVCILAASYRLCSLWVSIWVVQQQHLR